MKVVDADGLPIDVRPVAKKRHVRGARAEAGKVSMLRGMFAGQLLSAGYQPGEVKVILGVSKPTMYRYLQAFESRAVAG